MRNVQSRSFYEQMKGRGVRVISPDDFQAVTPDAVNKDRFVIVDAVGVTESEMSESYTLEREPTVSFGRLLDLIAMGSREPDHLSSLASRLARLSRKISPAEREAIETTAGGVPLQTLIANLLRATDPDSALEAARQSTDQEDPPSEAIGEAEKQLRDAAAVPFASNPELRQRLENAPPVLRSDHRHGEQGRRAGRGLHPGPGRRPGAVVPPVHRRQPGRDHRVAGPLRAPLPAAIALRRHQGAGRRDAGAAPVVDHGPVVAGVPAGRRVKGARIRPAGIGGHRIAGALRHRRRRGACPLRRPRQSAICGMAGYARKPRGASSPPSSGGGWRTSATTSPAASA